MHRKHAQRIAAHAHKVHTEGPGHRGGRGGRGGRGRSRREKEAPPTSASELNAWFAGQIPDDWFTEPVSCRVDRDEIVVTGALVMPKVTDEDDPAVAARSRIWAFREATRDDRIAVAQRAEATWHRSVTWAVTIGDEAETFSSANVPVMTRLGFDDRHVLDTLIDAGIARSRSEALAWCVRLVGDNEETWIQDLRAAMTDVERLRHEGPDSRRD